MSYTQAPPYSLQIEATEGCNLRCGACGIRSIREKGATGDLSGPYKFMDRWTAASCAKQMRAAGWNSRLEFAMHGEPTMNVELPDIVAEFRTRLPKASIMVTTNGIPLLDGAGWADSFREAIMELFSAGVNTIAIDDYAPHRVAPEARRTSLPVPVIEYPKVRSGNPNARFHGRRVVIVEDIMQATTGTHSTLNNHAGSGGPRTDEMQSKVCTIPFREMSIRWNGEIALCCNDWRGEYRAGHVNELVATWHGPEFMAARRILLHEGRANLTPCSGCNYRGTRTGLLPQPDGSGREAIGPITEEDRAVVRDVTVGTMTPVFLQRWER